MAEIETDYLVVGAGAAGLAFADALISDCDADVVLVDRRDRPGGHWNDAYPFVRLHQPSAFYGVNSRVLGADAIDEAGPNAGFYERATAAEICDYYQRVLDEQLLPSGRVRFFGSSDWLGHSSGERRFSSRLTGEDTTVRVRRRVVDARYLEPSIPALHTPPFGVEPGVRVIPVNDLVRLPEPPAGYTVVGAGKTAMDACVWLLEIGVPPEAIRWVRPRDSWVLDRAFFQPLDLVAGLVEGLSLSVEAAAGATDAADLLRRLEACGQLVRLDPAVEPAMYHCAILSDRELASLRRIENVVRAGRVLHIGLDQIVLERGSIPAGDGQVYVDCSAAGLTAKAARTVFAPELITLQAVRTCQPTFGAALVGYLEATRHDDAEKNRLCPPNPYPDKATDWMATNWISLRAQGLWLREPDLAAWLDRSRLNAARALRDHLAEPQMQAAITRLLTYNDPAIAQLERLLAGNGQAGTLSPA